MKTYTIKPLEWKETSIGSWMANDFSSVHLYEVQDFSHELKTKHVDFYALNYIGEDWYYEFTTIEAAKAKAQELHEAELMKYLQECTVIERNKPVAWMHVMDTTEGYEDAEPYRRLTFDENHPFGVAGEDYSEEYPVISHPLYLQEVTE